MSKKERLQLPAITLGRKGQHLDMSPLAKAKAFNKFGKPSEGDVIDGMMSLKDSTGWMEFALIRHAEGDMSLGVAGKLHAQLSL